MMKNRLLLVVGIGAIVISLVGPALAGATIVESFGSWGPFGHMRTGYMQGMMGWSSGDRGSEQVPPPIEAATEITVTLDDFSISVSAALVAGEPANVTVVNSGSAPHDFTVPDLDISIFAAPGETVVAGIPGQRAGTYNALCTIRGHASLGMVGRFVVQGRA